MAENIKNKRKEFNESLKTEYKKNTIKKDKKDFDPLEIAIANIERKLKEQGEDR